MIELLVEAKKLSYMYSNETHALKEVSIKIHKSERVAILGANGAGKSTFFLNLNGVLTPQSGTIHYRGKEIKNNKKDLMELRRTIGIVFQEPDNQIIASTVLGEVSFGPMNLKLSKEEVLNRVNEALKYMNIESYKDRPPHYLSGGEKKRVSIADIIAMKPEIIIFDEPTASLDPINAEMLERVLENMERQGMTILISTHDVEFAYRWAERIVVFSEGTIIADGTPIEIFEKIDILKKANLKRPMLLDVYQTLIDNDIIEPSSEYPKDIESLNKVIINNKKDISKI